MNDSYTASAPASVVGPVRLDLRFSLKSRLGERVSAPTWEKLRDFGPRAQEVADKLLQLQQTPHLGLLLVPQMTWEQSCLELGTFQISVDHMSQYQ